MKILIILILGAIITYHVLKWAARLLVPVLLKRLMRKMSEKQQNQGFYTYNSRTNAEHDQEGQVSIKRKPGKQSNYDVGGDYIDFEEVKD
jgi:hypothetical protein